MALSKVRLDPVEGVFSLRCYKDAGNSFVPLGKEGREYCAVGTITIAGNTAIGTALNGDIDDPQLWVDLDAELREKGVTTLHWQRHKNGQVMNKIRRIKP